MNYEQKYKEALEKLQEALAPTEDGCKISGLTRDCLEYIFPELKESEGERIRKEIITFLLSKNGYMTPDEDWDFHNRWLAWLEKQDEQQTDKVKPKFKIEKGKWYVCTKDLLDNYATKAFYKGDIYLSTQDGSLIPSNSNVHFKVACPDTYFRDWTIQDAKDGDVLVNSKGQPFIFSGKYDDINSGNPIAYCGVNRQNKFKIGNGTHWTNKNEVAPATKEQRDFLFQKMKEAGYEWDAEKKELKKVEHKMLNADEVIAWLNHRELSCWDMVTTVIPDDSPTSNPQRVKWLSDEFINKFKKDFKL